jgi:hypothetical protein
LLSPREARNRGGNPLLTIPTGKGTEVETDMFP